jgi:phosphonate transport system substrate-binding protein
MIGIARRSLLSGAAAALLAPAPIARASTSLSFGLTPVFLESDIALLDNLQSYLSRTLDRPVSLVKRRTYQEMTALLLSGELDAAWICGFPFVQHPDRLALVAVPLYRHRPLYQSYMIVPVDRNVSSWQELRGDVHAFSDPDSNSGYLVTTALLAENHLTPQSFFGTTFFTYGHRNVIRAVAAGLAGSGSVDGYIWDVMSDREPELVSKTRVLRRSELLGFPPVACLRSNHESAQIAQLANALVRTPEDDQGRRLLSMLQLDGFAVEPDSLFDDIAAKFALIQKQPA